MRGIAVRSPSILSAPSEVTVAMDVNRGYTDEFYQPTPRVAVKDIDGREYLDFVARIKGVPGGERFRARW